MMFELLCKGLLSVHNIENVSTLATMKTLATKESPSRLVLVPYIVKSCEPNGLGDMLITVNVTTFRYTNFFHMACEIQNNAITMFYII